MSPRDVSGVRPQHMVSSGSSARASLHAPASYAEAASALRAAADVAGSVRFRGGGTKIEWAACDVSRGTRGQTPGVADGDTSDLTTARLDGVGEHNVGDFTAVLQAGVRLAEAQERFAAEGQMLALDPPLGSGDAATVGGVVATGDSGPLRHRYGAARDLLLGITVALSDGTVAKSGGKVIKNVAGYDLAKLFAGSFGTLGAILEVVVRLHPRPRSTATAVGESDDLAALARAALALARAPLELEALDLSWEDGRGCVLARVGGAAALARATAITERMELDAHLEDEDEELWSAQRECQRSRSDAVVRISALPTELERAIGAAAALGGSVVARAGLGLAWARVPPDAAAVTELRRRLDPFACVLLDAPAEVREQLLAAGGTAPSLALARRVKERFDAAGVCNPGLAVL